ncbi:hypothetical protein D5R81_11935 [Parashewanella spongiae]|uniref:Uncharacterized protein n=1 Tax=Parashewanella spongiae TaxID=342950 RepID=A0A3A6TVG5_9GAMM|nr:hypothetical protein D5R81_11935 [Parashewanella spongiae]
MKLYEIALLFLAFVSANLLISAVPVYLLWNWVVPDLFSLPHIGFLQASGLVLLIQFLFNTRKLFSKE